MAVTSVITIQNGRVNYEVNPKEHQKNLKKLKQLPRVLEKISEMSKFFIGKPQFIIQQDGQLVKVIREDYRQILENLINKPEEEYFQRLSLSEFRLLAFYHRERVDLPITIHDVYEQQGVTIKTGNLFRNNAWEEFYRALMARYLGIVEAKSPLGFVFWLDDIYGVKKPGKMFYRNLTGIDLEAALRAKDADLLNWALWETGKFFSRLINAHLYLEDSDRLGNYFIEENHSTKIFRFLDLERLRYEAFYSNEKKVEMLTKFIKMALEVGLLDLERLGEFIIVSLGNRTQLMPQIQEFFHTKKQE